MSLHDRRLWRGRDALPLFVVIVLHAWVSGAWPVDLVVVLAILIALLLPSRITVSPFVARIVMTVCIGIGAFLGWLHTPDLGYGAGTLARGGSLVAVAALLAAASRLYMVTPPRGYQVTFVFGLIALGASGATRLGPIYGVFAIAYVASGLLVMRAQDLARSPWRDLAKRHRASIVVSLAIATVLGVGVDRALPHLYDAAQRAFERAYRARDTIGFSDSASLGALREMLRSDEEVLRLSGDTDYLRGAVYDRYHVDGSWGRSRRAEMQDTFATRTGAPSPDAIRVHRVSGDASRYFFPIRARNIITEAGFVIADAPGAVRVATKMRANDYAFEIGDRDGLTISEPGPEDSSIPESERATLTRIAEEWTKGASTPAEKLERIHDRLKTDYAYSLDYLRDGPDPLLDFLEVHKLGYCTYFGSAMTLLARAAGVPARLVAGYRVAEKNPLTGEFIVREDNAHAWSEAYVGGQWTRYDATPASDVVQNLPHDARFTVIASDLIAAAWGRFVAWFERLTLVDILLTLGGTFALWVLVRALRGRGRKDQASGDGVAAASRPLPCFLRFEAVLAGRGYPRAASESLEGYAVRLAKEHMEDAAALLLRYAALRYGGEGSADAVALAMDAFSTGPVDGRAQGAQGTVHAGGSASSRVESSSADTEAKR